MNGLKEKRYTLYLCDFEDADADVDATTVNGALVVLARLGADPDNAIPRKYMIRYENTLEHRSMSTSDIKLIRQKEPDPLR